MAKAAVGQKQELAPVRGTAGSALAQVSSDLEDEFAGVEGAGRSDNSADRGTPLIYVAQKISPQVDKNKPEFIPGLEAGNAFNNLTGEFWDAEGEGLDFLPCFFRANWLEWVPRDAGGGFKGSHPFMTDAELQRFGARKDPDRGDRWHTAEGHDLVLTHQYFGVLPATMSPAVVPMSSTNLGASRRMQNMIDSARVETASGRVATLPAWFLPWKLRTVYKSNDQGSWYGWAPQRLGHVQDESTYTAPDVRALCRAFYDACVADQVKVAQPMSDAEAGAGDESVPI
jgi:hypothetical protein